MKHRDQDRRPVERILRWLGPTTLSPTQWHELEDFAYWLEEEAILAGGLGPRESPRIWSRHLADSLTFAYGWKEAEPPLRLLDIGAGVGLPGIPLAILWPETQVTLLDRAGRRIDLARRAVRRLNLKNVDVQQGDAHSQAPVWEGAVMRAVYRPEEACLVAASVLHPTGTAVIGLRGSGSEVPTKRVSVNGRTIRVVDIPATVLDGTASLLIMGPREH